MSIVIIPCVRIHIRINMESLPDYVIRSMYVYASHKLR
jgi:hypothetical protein